MGIFGEVKELYNDLSGKTRLEKLQKEYDTVIYHYNYSVQYYEKNRLELEKMISDNISTKNECINLISEYKNMFYTEKTIDYTKYKFEGLSQYDSINYSIPKCGLGSDIKALAIGGGLSTLAFILTGTFGTASTGTAIATLSGAAATNATLAALGGGALYAGGGGMAAGSTLLGGIAIAPLIGLEIYKTYKRNKASDQIESEISKLRVTRTEVDIKSRKIVQMQKDLKKFNICIKKIKEEYENAMEQIIAQANIITDNFIKMLEDFSKIENGHLVCDSEYVVENYLKNIAKRENEFKKIINKYINEQLDIVIKN